MHKYKPTGKSGNGNGQDQAKLESGGRHEIRCNAPDRRRDRLHSSLGPDVEPLHEPVARAVARSGLPERTIKRRFKAATGVALITYVQNLRIEEAKRLLETGGTAIDVIASLLPGRRR